MFVGATALSLDFQIPMQRVAADPDLIVAEDDSPTAS